MLKTIVIRMATASLLVGVAAGGAIAQAPHEGMQPSPEQTGQFQRLDQPLWLKGVVTTGGLGLISLELWWFLLSKPKSRPAIAQAGIQEVTVTVDGGYDPSQIVVQAGQPVRLNFNRKDPNRCLDEVRFPDFQIAQELPLNQTTAIEFTPEHPGQYEFTCGMNMFRGVIDVQDHKKETERAIASLPQNSAH
jgi:plastocyanin domain-containing protein